MTDDILPPPPPPVSSAPAATATAEPAPVDLVAGRPLFYPSTWAWLLAGARRQPVAIPVALAAAWTGLWLVLWVAALGAVVGAVAAFVIATGLVPSAASQAAGVVGIVTGTVAGAAAGAGLALNVAVVQAPVQFLVALIAGALVSLCVLLLLVVAEPLTMRLRGYRRMSRREAVRVLPLLQGAALRMQLRNVPPVLVADDGRRNAHTALRHVVVGKPLLEELNDEQLAAILAHELAHWASGDAVALQLVFAAAWPLALLYNLSAWLTTHGGSIGRILGWVLLWPTIVLTRGLVEPAVAARSRRAEYQADAAARAAGYAPALQTALSYLGDFEGGRSGWEQVIVATHPPTELRLEALESHDNI